MHRRRYRPPGRTQPHHSSVRSLLFSGGFFEASRRMLALLYVKECSYVRSTMVTRTLIKLPKLKWTSLEVLVCFVMPNSISQYQLSRLCIRVLWSRILDIVVLSGEMLG